MTEDEAERTPVVPFVVPRCPYCSGPPKTYGQKGRVRYHRCRDCRRKYRSLEVPASQVNGFREPGAGADATRDATGRP